MNMAEEQDLLTKAAGQADRIADDLTPQIPMASGQGQTAIAAAVAAARRVAAASRLPPERKKQ